MPSIAAAVAQSKTLAEATRITVEAQRQQLRQWKQALFNEALECFVAQHLGPRWQRRRGHTPWACPSCGPREAQQVKRNGHYRRGLVVLEGLVRLRVPQLCCVECGKGVSLMAPFLPARSRFWGDLDRQVTEAYLSGASYRQVKGLVERAMPSDVGLMTLYRRFQRQAEAARRPNLHGALSAVYLDEVYLRVAGKPRWGLLALGETAKGSRCYLGATMASERSQGAWQGLLEGLNLPDGGRGLRVVHDGDQAIAGAVAMALPWADQQRWVWHDLQNLIRRAREAYPQDQTGQREAIRHGVLALRANWPSYPRATSPLERRIKELRRRIRPMDGFGSFPGASRFLKVWLTKENARALGQDWLEVCTAWWHNEQPQSLDQGGALN